MNLGIIWHIAKKEWLSTVRDRRAMISSLLIPLLIFPVVMLGLPFLLGGLFEREQATATKVGTLGLEYLGPELKTLLEEQNLELHQSLQPQQDVLEGRFEVGLEIPPSFNSDIQQNQGNLKLYNKRGNIKSELNAGKVQDAVDHYRQTLVKATLQQQGLDEAILEPITIETIDASTKAEKSSGQLAWLIPFFIAIWTLMGGQVTAIDATAGEKERGTLESLLVTPTKRIEIVLGKFLATMGFGLLASMMAILGYVLSGVLLKQLFASQLGQDGNEIVTLMGGSLDIGPLRLLLLMVSALLLSGLIASALMSITLFARSFKEAQSYIAPLSLIMVFPAMGLQFADFFGTNVWVYIIPILNVLLLMNNVVKGKLELLPLLLTWGSLIGFTVLLLDVAYRNFRREGVIFRT
jgi:sodium transport system permease protein